MPYNVNFQVTFSSEEAAVKALSALEDKQAALHNHIATAVENPEGFGKQCPATELVAELRLVQEAAKCIRGAIYGLHGYQYIIPK